MLITFSRNDLSSWLLKIEQKKYHRIFFPQISTKWFRLSFLATTNFKFRVWLIGFLFSISSDCLQRTCHDIWPLQMSPVARTNFALGEKVKFKPGFQNPGWKNRSRDLGNRASPPSHMNTLKLEVNKRDHGNRAHVRKP